MYNRCNKCFFKKSILLDCKCGNKYCPKDILPEIHKCTEINKFRQEAHEKNKNILMENNKKQKLEWIE